MQEKPTEISAYSYRSCAADQVALMDAIGVQGKFHVVGHDWSVATSYYSL